MPTAAKTTATPANSPITCVRNRGYARFLNAPVSYALAVIGQDWASYLVSAGAVAGITSVLLVMLMSQPRIFFATETTTKWAELDALTTRFLGVGVTAETADTFGLQVLGVGAAVFAAGWVLARVSGEK